MQYHDSPERKRLIEQLHYTLSNTDTLADLYKIRDALRQWVRDHPEDFGIRDAFEVLSHREDYLLAGGDNADVVSGS